MPAHRTPDVCHRCRAPLIRGQNWTIKAKRCKACNAARSKELYHRNPAPRRAYMKQYYKNLRAEVLAAYGGQCACCGENHVEFLNVDHVDGTGAAHRRTVPGNRILQWLKLRGFPKDGFQLLCWNCNCAKGVYGRCPHESEPLPTSFPWAA